MSQPLYKVVIEIIIGRISSGALAPGAMLPSETDLGAELGVSQGTARKALMELEQRGLVQRSQGRGTFVTVRTPESSLFNFFRLRPPGGAPAGTLVKPALEHERIHRRASTGQERAFLFGAPQEVLEIERVRSLNGRPLVHEVSVVPQPLFPGLSERAPLPNTLYVFYQHAYSCIITRADEQIRATGATAHAAVALGIREGTPVLEVERIAIDLLDRAVERRISICLTEGFSYHVSLEPV